MKEVKKQAPPEQHRGFIAEWTVTILMLLFGTSTLLQAFVVPTGSMESTILIGDHLFVDKLAYAPSSALGRHVLPYREIKRGDIIVFRWPPDISIDYVKRVIGLPGDRLRLIDKQVYVNGKKLDEPYVQHIFTNIDPYRDNFPAEPDGMVTSRGLEMLRDHVVNGEVVVPPGNYFAMGDNRDNSADSRYWGFVPRENIKGKPVLNWWSYDAPTSELIDPNPLSPDHLLDLAQNFFTKTRWRRTFLLVRGYPGK
jgi:signal peptidase I